MLLYLRSRAMLGLLTATDRADIIAETIAVAEY